jgi:hypothetical protein
MLKGAGIARIVAMAALVGATVWYIDDLMSGSFALGTVAGTVGFLAILSRVTPISRRR